MTSTLLQQLRHLEFAYPASTDWKTIKPDSGLEADSRFAAVLVPILDRSEPAILLTKRSSRLAYQPGHISFPGGRPQEDDPDVASTFDARLHDLLVATIVELDGVGVSACFENDVIFLGQSLFQK